MIPTLVAILILCIACNIVVSTLCDSREVRVLLSALFNLLSILVVIIIFDKTEVRSIDVYRGKTELKITEERVNGVVTKRDSVVIYKNR